MTTILFFISLVLLAVLAGIIDVVYARSVYDVGMVIDKKIIDETSLNNYELYENAHGVMFQDQGLTNERVLLFVQNSFGDIYVVDCSKSFFYDIGAFQDVKFEIKKGRFTKINWIVQIAE